MKKHLILAAALILFAVSSLAAGTSILVKGTYLLPSDQDFKDIYGGGLMYGGELNVGITKNLMLWAGGSYFSKRGKLTFTQEDTTLKLLPLGGGVKMKITFGLVDLYAGGGLRYYQFKESSVPMGVAEKGGIGYVGTIGVMVSTAKKWVFDFFVNYSYCKMTPRDFTINIGGIEMGIGFGYKLR